MKKLFRSLFVLALGLLVVSSLNLKAQELPVEAIDGASIRSKVDEEVKQGLRFYAKLGESVKQNEHGFYLAFGKVTVGELEAVLDDAQMELNDKVVHKVIVPGVNNENQFSVVLTGIPGVGYLDKVTAIPFVVVDEQIVFDEAITRSIGEVALKLANNGEGSGNDVITYLEENVKRAYFNIFGEIELTGNMYETDHFELREEFIKDWNEMFGTTWTDLVGSTFNSSANIGQVADDLSGSNSYKFFNDPILKEKWDWVLDIMVIKGAGTVWPKNQAEALLGDGTLEGISNLHSGRHLHYSIANFFNGNRELYGDNGASFETPNAYKDIMHLIEGVYIDSNKYEFFKIGDEIPIGQAEQRDGYTFLHFLVDEEELLEGAMYEITAADVVVEFIYQVNDYDLKFYLEDELLEDLSTTFTIEDEIVLEPLVKEGYAFEGWYDNEEFLGDPITTIDKGTFEHVTLYAKATSSEYVQVDVTFNLNGGNLDNPADLMEFRESTLLVANRYHTSGDGLGKDLTISPAGLSYWYVMGFKETSISGVYELLGKGSSYTNEEADIFVSFHDGNDNKTSLMSFYNSISAGQLLVIPELPESYQTSASIDMLFMPANSLTDDVTVKLQDPEAMPVTPVREGFNFLGWFLDEELLDGPIASYPGYKPIDETTAVTYYAKWEPIAPNTVTFNLNYDGAVNPENQVLGFGEKAIEPPAPTRDDYVFLGWFDGEIEFDFNQVVDKDFDLVAKWTEESEAEFLAFIDEVGYLSIADAIAAAGNGDVIKLAEGEHDVPFTVNKNGLSFTSVDGKVAVISAKVTVGADMVGLKFENLEFTGDAYIHAPAKIDQFEFLNNNVYDLNLVPTQFVQGTTHNAYTRVDINAFIRLYTFESSNQTGDVLIDGNEFKNIDATVISIDRTSLDKEIVITNNVFHNFTQGAIKFDGGYNNGTYLIQDNVFKHDVRGGADNVIIFRAFAPETGNKQIINILNNHFINVGNLSQPIYEPNYHPGSGVITFSVFNDRLTEVNINGNLFKGTANSIHFRNAGAVADLSGDFRGNIFEDNDGYYLYQVRPATHPAPEADFTENIFKDEEGQVITDFALIEPKIINNKTYDQWED